MLQVPAIRLRSRTSQNLQHEPGLAKHLTKLLSCSEDDVARSFVGSAGRCNCTRQAGGATYPLGLGGRDACAAGSQVHRWTEGRGGEPCSGMPPRMPPMLRQLWLSKCCCRVARGSAVVRSRRVRAGVPRFALGMELG